MKKRSVVIGGLLILALIGVIGFWGLKNRGRKPSIFFGQQVMSAFPLEIRLTNFSENSFTVSWLTEKEVFGGIKYGTSPESLDKIVKEEAISKKAHFVQLKNLKPNEDYYFLIVSDNHSYVHKNGQSFIFKTPSLPNTPPLPPSVLYGKIKDNNGNPAENALVYLTFPDSTPISTFTDNQGNYNFSLENMRKKDDLSKYYQPIDGERGFILAQTGEKDTSSYFALKKDSQLKTLELGFKQDVAQKDTAQDERDREQLSVFDKQESSIYGEKPVVKEKNIWQKAIELVKSIFGK